MPDTLPALSIIIPVFNERENIEHVVDEVVTVTEAHYPAIEIILVDDGSDDGSGTIVLDLAADHARVHAVVHPERAGKSAALRTGALAARGRWIGTMDGDGQDDPRDLLNMAREIDLHAIDDVGIVAGTRIDRTDGGDRKLASRLANGIRRTALRDNCPDTACGLKILPRDIFLALPFFDAIHRYLPAFVQHFGYEARYVPVTNRPRRHGESKYTNFGRAMAGLGDLLGVMWLLRRTHYPSRDLLLRADRQESLSP